VFTDFTYTTFSSSPPYPSVLITEDANNSLDSPQTLTLTMADVTTETSSWEFQAGLEIGIKTTLETGIPFVADGKMEVSVTASISYKYGEVITKTTDFSKSAPVTLPARTKARVTVTGTKYNATVNFTCKAKYTYSDGCTTTDNNVTGKFTGTQIRNGTTTWVPL